MERLIVICVSLFLTFNASQFFFIFTVSLMESYPNKQSAIKPSIFNANSLISKTKPKVKSLEEIGITPIRMFKVKFPDSKNYEVPEYDLEKALSFGGEIVTHEDTGSFAKFFEKFKIMLILLFVALETILFFIAVMKLGEKLIIKDNKKELIPGD